MRYRTASAVMTLAVGLGLAAPAAVSGQQDAPHHGAVYTPDEFKWQKGPPSLPEGAQFVIVEGDPSKAGEYFAFRLRMPDGYRIPPHWHPVHERVTVITGTFHLGQGARFDEEATEALGPGSYFVMPPESRHFAHVEGETIIQLNSVGPWEIRYVNPEDDPRKSTER